MFVDYNNTLNYWFSCEHKHPFIDSQYCTHILVAQVYWENQEPTCYDNFACLCLVCIIQGKDWKFNLIIKISKHFASRSILTRKFCSPIKKQLQQGGKSKQKQEWIILSVCLKTSLDAIIVQNCLQFFPFFQHWKLILSGPDFLSTSE